MNHAEDISGVIKSEKDPSPQDEKNADRLEGRFDLHQRTRDNSEKFERSVTAKKEEERAGKENFSPYKKIPALSLPREKAGIPVLSALLAITHL